MSKSLILSKEVNAIDELDENAAKYKVGFFGVYRALVFDDSLSSSDKLVYISLCAFLKNKENIGFCYPSQSLLAKLTSLSQSTIKRSTEVLKEKGFININKKGNHYIYEIKRQQFHLSVPKTQEENTTKKNAKQAKKEAFDLSFERNYKLEDLEDKFL